MSLLHLYRTPGISAARLNALLLAVQQRITPDIETIRTEYCFNVDASDALSDSERETLIWLLSETFEPDGLRDRSFLKGSNGLLLEVGPRMNFTTAWSTNAVAVCHSCGLAKVRRIERSRRYLLDSAAPVSDEQRAAFLAEVHDRMTETEYAEPLQTFETGVSPEPVFEIPVLEEGRAALERINRGMGLAFDDWDLDYYTGLFRDKVGRNPTNVECFDIAQSNSEHSRHWFFKGKLVIDGEEVPKHLIAMIKEPLDANPNNSVIAFNDNSSAIRGYTVRTILPSRPGEPSAFVGARCSAVSRSGDRKRRKDPRHSCSGTRLPLRGRHRCLLRGQPAHPRLRIAVGGSVLQVPRQPRLAARNRDRSL